MGSEKELRQHRLHIFVRRETTDEEIRSIILSRQEHLLVCMGKIM